MFSGIQEILVIIAILLGIFFIPRMTGKYRSSASGERRPVSVRFQLSGRRRLALLVSLLWSLGAAIYLEPWHAPFKPFLFYGLGPVLLFWGIIWVVAGYSANRTK